MIVAKEEKRSVMKKILIIASIFLFFLLSGWGLSAQKTKIVGGITIITNGKNPNPPKGIPSSIRWEEDFTIGAGDDLEQSFALVSSFVVDDEGTIYALDTQDTKIKIYDRSGNFLMLFGQKGQGPGPAEYTQSPIPPLTAPATVQRQM